MNKGIGEAIVSVRKEARKTQKEFAKLMHVAEATQVGYETGSTTPSLEYLQRVATYSGRTVASLLGEPVAFRTQRDILECIHGLNDIGVLKLGHILAEGLEDTVFDQGVVRYLRELEDATNGDIYGHPEKMERLLVLYESMSAPVPGNGFDPLSAASCKNAEVRARDIWFGYAGGNPVIVGEVLAKNGKMYDIMVPAEANSQKFVHLQEKVKDWPLVKDAELFLAELHEAMDFFPEEDPEFSLTVCRAWEISLPCQQNKTLVVSAFARGTMAPLTIIFSSVVAPCCYENGAPEYAVPYSFVHRIPTHCNSDGKAKQLAGTHGVVSPLCGLADRSCKHCQGGDGGKAYREEQEELAVEAPMPKIFW